MHLFCRSLIFSSLVAGVSAAPFVVPEKVDVILDVYCYSCHGEDFQKGKLRLDQIADQPLDARLNLLNKVQEQIFFKEMPPRDEESQPTDDERATVFQWINTELRTHNASKLEEKLTRSEFGNYVDHKKLFSGEYANVPGFTYDRRWLVSEFIFDEKINKLVDHRGIRTIDGKRQDVIGDNGVGLGTGLSSAGIRQSITNPFLLPNQIGVRYYDTTSLTTGHLLTMISNARKIAAHMTSEQVMKEHYPAMNRIMQLELEHQKIMVSRENFLTAHIEHLLQDLFKDKHQQWLPNFTRVTTETLKDRIDNKGNPAKLFDNIELLHGRYDNEDIKAIFLGLNEYSQGGVTSFENIIEKCERDWFEFGINIKRIQNRVSVMKIMQKDWDMDLIWKDVWKKNWTSPAYQPLDAAEMKLISTALLKHRKKGDTYTQVIDKCMLSWEQSFKATRAATDVAGDKAIGDLVDELYLKILEREPTKEEAREEIDLTKGFIEARGKQAGIVKLIESLLLSSDLVYRHEFGVGRADENGRKMMSPRDASYALSYALTDSSPDAELAAAAREGRLNTREDYRREVTRMLASRDQYYVIDETVQKQGFNASITNTPIRKLRFFREFFGYPKALSIFKDDERFNAAWSKYDDVKGRLVDEADMLVDYILKNDKHVFEELLSTEDFYVYHSGDNEAMKAASDRLKKIYDYFKVYDWENFTSEELYKHWEFINEMKMMGTVFPNFINSKRKDGWLNSFKTLMTSYTLRFGNGQTSGAPYDAVAMAHWHKGESATRTGTRMRGEEVGRLFNIDYANWNYPTTQPAKIPHRKGMLTHPAWLIAHSLNLETDPVRRGKWVLEKLLAGTVPDVPITVDAVIPEDHHRTLRMRLDKKTGAKSCWKCHERMNPLGLAFEMYDDFGRFREKENLEHPENIIKPGISDRGIEIDNRPTFKTLPVNAKGFLKGTGDAKLDGEVVDAIDLAERLAKSSKARQSIIRHAFRYFLGRNEQLSDSKTLIDAEQAYLKSEGSFDAVIISLLTSDSFIYRKPTPQEHHAQ